MNFEKKVILTLLWNFDNDGELGVLEFWISGDFGGLERPVEIKIR